MEIDFRELRSLSPYKLRLVIELIKRARDGKTAGISLREFSGLVGLESNRLAPLLRFPKKEEWEKGKKGQIILTEKVNREETVGKRVPRKKVREETVYYLEPNFLNKVLNTPYFNSLNLNIIDKEHRNLELPDIRLSVEYMDKKRLRVSPPPKEIGYFWQIGTRIPARFRYSDGRGVSSFITRYRIEVSIFRDKCVMTNLSSNWQLPVVEQRSFIIAMGNPQYEFILNREFEEYNPKYDDIFELRLTANEPSLRCTKSKEDISLYQMYGIGSHYIRRRPTDYRFRENYLDEEGKEIISDILGFEPIEYSSCYWFGMRCSGKLPLCSIEGSLYGLCVKPYHQGISSTTAIIKYDQDILEIKSAIPDIIRREPIGQYPNTPEGYPYPIDWEQDTPAFIKSNEMDLGKSWEIMPYRESPTESWHDWYVDSRLHVQLLRWQVELKEKPSSIVILKSSPKPCGGESCPERKVKIK